MAQALPSRFKDPGRKTSAILLSIAVVLGIIVTITGITSGGTDWEASQSADIGADAEIITFFCLIFWFLNFKRLRSSDMPVKKWYLSPGLDISIAVLSILLFLYLTFLLAIANSNIGG